MRGAGATCWRKEDRKPPRAARKRPPLPLLGGSGVTSLLPKAGAQGSAVPRAHADSCTHTFQCEEAGGNGLEVSPLGAPVSSVVK